MTLLDVLDLIKDGVDTLAYRKSCRMMICGSCGMRMDGAAVLACKTRMYDIVQSGHVPVISAMGNLPVVKDLVVDMEPFWGKIRAVQPWLDSGYADPGEKEHVVSQEQMDVIHKESLCIMCGCCVSGVQLDGGGPGLPRPGCAREGHALRRGRSRSHRGRAAPGVLRRARDLGLHALLLLSGAPQGVDPRDAIAKLGAQAMEKGIDSDMGAKHARWFVTSAKTTGWLRETELVPKTQGVVSALRRSGSRCSSSSAVRCRPGAPARGRERRRGTRAV